MDVRRVDIEGYRSVRRLTFPVERLNVFVGENGVGKTNLYRALELIQASARGTLAKELASEGGLSSAMWTGVRKEKAPARISLGVRLGPLSDSYRYSAETGFVQQYKVDAGAPVVTAAAFPLEPQIKEETLTFHGSKRPEVLLERRGPHVAARDEEGVRHDLDLNILASETALGSFNEPGRFPDLHAVRTAMLDWRFYHSFRTDRGSPLRAPCLATTTPTLSSDGSDLAAVFATLAHIRGDTVDLDTTIADAFAGARIIVPAPERTASFALVYKEFPKRQFEPSELSDGTLRFLALTGALLGYRLPRFIALNEPETSLHGDLLPALARLIAKAAERTQVWVVTHSTVLADALAEAANITPRHVVKREGETSIEGLTITGEFRDSD
jgi:predicted ATPase